MFAAATRADSRLGIARTFKELANIYTSFGLLTNGTGSSITGCSVTCGISFTSGSDTEVSEQVPELEFLPAVYKYLMQSVQQALYLLN